MNNREIKEFYGKFYLSAIDCFPDQETLVLLKRVRTFRRRFHNDFDAGIRSVRMIVVGDRTSLRREYNWIMQIPAAF
jgi:hypothetical protein